MQKLRISFPHMGNYCLPIKVLLEDLFPRQEVLVPPPITKRTLELGSGCSPDCVCAPFKYNMGNFLQALDAGANVLMQTGLGCRYGYYGEVQQQILKDMGYEFQFLSVARKNALPLRAYRRMQQLGSEASFAKFSRSMVSAVRMVGIMDSFEFYMRENIGFARDPKAFVQLHEDLLEALPAASTDHSLGSTGRRYMRQLRSMPLYIPEKPLRVGVVGELYTLMEPHANFYLERTLSQWGIQVSRRMSVSFLIFGKWDKRTIGQTGDYLRYSVGANGIDSVAQSLAYAKAGYDGIIHLKSFGCTPELNAMPSLMRISEDYKIPILHLSMDSHTSETGLYTRLEAFADMLTMKKERGNADDGIGRGHRVDIHQGRPIG